MTDSPTLSKLFIPPHVITTVIDGLTHANGPGVHFILVVAKDNENPITASTLDTTDMDALLDWMKERRDRRGFAKEDLDSESFKKGH